MSSLSLTGNSDARSSSSSSSRLPAEVEDQYHEVQQRLAAAAPLPSAAALPGFVRNMHNFVQLAAARHKHKEMSDVTSLSDIDSDLQETQKAVLDADIQQTVRLSELEEQLYKADVQLQDLRVEVVAAEAQEAAQSAEWQDFYDEEASKVRSESQEAAVYDELIKQHMQTVQSSSSSSVDLQCLRFQVAGFEGQTSVERTRLRSKLAELQEELGAVEKLDQSCHLEANAAEDVRAHSSSESRRIEDALVQAQAEAKAVADQVRSSQSALRLAEEGERQVVQQMDALRSEQQVALTTGNELLAKLYTEMHENGMLLDDTRQEMRVIKQGLGQSSEVHARLRELEMQKQQTQDSMFQGGEDQRQFALKLNDFLRVHGDVQPGTAVISSGSADAIRRIQEDFALRSSRVTSAEDASAAEASSQRASLMTEEQLCMRLGNELLEEKSVQRDLNDELHALSSAAASVRAVIVAKDETISSIVASTFELASEMAAMKMTMESSAAEPSGNDNDVQMESNAAATISGRSTSLEQALARAGPPHYRPPSPPGSPRSTKGSGKSGFDDSRTNSLHEATQNSLGNSGDFIRWQPDVGQDMDATTSTASTGTAMFSSSERLRDRSADTMLSAATSTPVADFLLASRLQPGGSQASHSSGGPPAALDRSLGSAATREAPDSSASASASPEPSVVASSALQEIEDLVGSSLTLAGTSLEPGSSWEMAQTVMTEQLRSDIVTLRQMFAELGISAAGVGEPERDSSPRKGQQSQFTRSSSPRVKLNAVQTTVASLPAHGRGGSLHVTPGGRPPPVPTSPRSRLPIPGGINGASSPRGSSLTVTAREDGRTSPRGGSLTTSPGVSRESRRPLSLSKSCRMAMGRSASEVPRTTPVARSKSPVPPQGFETSQSEFVKQPMPPLREGVSPRFNAGTVPQPRQVRSQQPSVATQAADSSNSSNAEVSSSSNARAVTMPPPENHWRTPPGGQVPPQTPRERPDPANPMHGARTQSPPVLSRPGPRVSSATPGEGIDRTNPAYPRYHSPSVSLSGDNRAVSSRGAGTAHGQAMSQSARTGVPRPDASQHGDFININSKPLMTSPSLGQGRALQSPAIPKTPQVSTAPHLNQVQPMRPQPHFSQSSKMARPQYAS